MMRKVGGGDNNNKRTSRGLRLRYPNEAKKHGKLRKYNVTNLTLWSIVSANLYLCKR
jgi:hypothetical protein